MKQEASKPSGGEHVIVHPTIVEQRETQELSDEEVGFIKDQRARNKPGPRPGGASGESCRCPVSGFGLWPRAGRGSPTWLRPESPGSLLSTRCLRLSQRCSSGRWNPGTRVLNKLPGDSSPQAGLGTVTGGTLMPRRCGGGMGPENQTKLCERKETLKISVVLWHRHRSDRKGQLSRAEKQQISPSVHSSPH